MTFFFKDKTVEMLLILGKNGVRKKYTTRIARELNTESTYCNKVLRRFEELGLIKKEEEGRIKIISLTEKGKEVVNKLYEIQQIIQLKRRL